jgi:MFS family permease
MTSQTAHQDHSPARDTYKWKALLTVALGTIMATMDASITNIAFPVLTKVFQADLTTVVWVTVAYILVSTSTMLIIGKIGDLMGRKKIYSLGMGIFTLGLLACSVAQTVGQLIFFRALQGVGAAMTVSTSTAIVTEAFPRNEVGRGIGFLGMSVSVGFIIGPILGGFLLDWLDWRSIFYVRAPVSLVGFILALFLLKMDQVRGGGLKLDLMGTLTSSAGIFSFVFGIVPGIPDCGPGPDFSLLVYFGRKTGQGPYRGSGTFQESGLFQRYVGPTPDLCGRPPLHPGHALLFDPGPRNESRPGRHVDGRDLHGHYGDRAFKRGPLRPVRALQVFGNRGRGYWCRLRPDVRL